MLLQSTEKSCTYPIIQFVSYYLLKNVLKSKHYGATVTLESYALNLYVSAPVTNL